MKDMQLHLDKLRMHERPRYGRPFGIGRFGLVDIRLSCLWSISIPEDGLGQVSDLSHLAAWPDANFKFFRDTLYVDYHRLYPPGKRILEGDVVQITGEFVGIKNYQAVGGATIQVP